MLGRLDRLVLPAKLAFGISWCMGLVALAAGSGAVAAESLMAAALVGALAPTASRA